MFYAHCVFIELKFKYTHTFDYDVWYSKHTNMPLFVHGAGGGVCVCVISKLPFSFGFCNINVMTLFRIQRIRSYCIDRAWTRQRQWRESMRFSRLLNACKISLKLMKWIYWLHIVKKTAPNRITGAKTV